MMMVHPAGNTELCRLRSLALKKRPPKTGVTVRVWPLGRCTVLGAIFNILPAMIASKLKVVCAASCFVYHLD